MTIAFSATFEAGILNWLRGTAMPAAPTGLKFGLLTAEPDHNAVNIYELQGANNYARQPITFGAVTTDTPTRVSSMKNNIAVIFGPVTDIDWVTAVYGAVFDAVSGAMLCYGPLAAQKTAPVGDTISFGINSIQIRQK